jgi:hypothetical protein
MKFTATIWQIILIILVLFLFSCSTSPKINSAKLNYESSKPYTRWWWFASIIKERDVQAQLDWVKKNNFGGVEIAFVYPLNRKRFFNEKNDTTYTPRQEWLSPEWSEIVAFTKKYADSIGIGCDFTFGTGWPFGDTYVKREDATQTYNEKYDSLKWTSSVVSWEYPKKGFVLNHMDSSAFQRYALRIGNALNEALKGKRSGLFCDSWEVETKRIWTSGFEKEFIKRFGYDIIPYMDSIYSTQFANERYDYLSLVSDYVLTQFYKPFTATCNKLGCYSRVQCAGAPIDLISGYSSVDVPETEAMLYEPGYSVIVASSASLGKKRVVSSETFTCTYGFPVYNKETKKMDFKKRGKEQVADLKLIADALFANGTNQIIWHGMPYNPVGIDTIRFYASVHVGTSGNLSRDIPEFNAYMQKVSEYMKQGVNYSDIAIYLPTEDSWMTGNMKNPDPQQPWAWGEYEMRNVRMPKELDGFHPLWINAEYLNKGTLNNGKLYAGDAIFSYLYVDVEYLRYDALTAILSLAKKGFPVCIKKAFKEPGKQKSPDYNTKYLDLMKLPNVSDKFKPDHSPLVEGDSLPDFWCRRYGENYFLFFANPKSKNLKLPLTLGQSYCNATIDKNVKINLKGIKIPYELKFKPYQSLMLKINDKGKIEAKNIEYYPTTPLREY